jgi:phosphoglycerol transferase
MTTVPIARPNAITPRTWAFVACVALAFFAFFVLRGVGLEPIVFADEWMHSVNTRLVPLMDVSSPSYLYYYVYRPTRSCGFAFLDCARLMNIAVFAAAGLMFFLFALRYVATGLAVVLFVIFLGAPSNIYVLLFSPDALFYSTFVFFFVSLLLLDNAARAIVSGLLLGLLALIKINAIFLLPGILLFFLLEHRIDRRHMVDSLVSALLMVISFLVSKMTVGYLLAGSSGLSITGQHYAGIASQGLDLAAIIARLPLFAFSIAGYLASVLLLLGTPLLSFFLTKPRMADSDRTLGCAALCILLPPLLIFGMFAALVSDSGPYESIRRLSLRYFTFVFPFFYLLGLSVLAKLDEAPSVRTKILSALAVVATVVTIFVIAHDYQPNLNESPELVFLTHSRSSLVIGSALILLPLLLVLFRPALAAPGYLASLLLLALVWNVVSLRELRFLRIPSPFDAAGRYAALYLGPERANVAVLGTDLGGMFRAMFHLNAAGPIGVQLTSATTREELVRQLQTKKWVLLIGPDALRFAPPDTNAPSGFALVPSAALVR